METIKKITETFKGEGDIIIICSKKLAQKLNQELADINVPDTQKATFKNENKVDLGFTAFYYNGVTLHYTSDFEKFIEGIKKR